MTRELEYKDARNFCPEISFDCKSTAELSPLTEIVGQSRAVKALRFGLRIKDKGFNIFISGMPGTGRKTAAGNFIRELAKDMPVPDDWAYVNNFHDSTEPQALRLPAGSGIVLKKEMEKFVAGIATALRDAFESNEYMQRRTATLQTIESKKTDFVTGLNQMATAAGFQIAQSPIGLMLVPIIQGKPVTDEELAKLPPETLKDIEKRKEAFQTKVQEAMVQLRDLERQSEEKVVELNREITTYVLEPRLLGIRERFKGFPEVIEFIKHVEDDILDNVPAIVQGEQPQQGPMGVQAPTDGPDHDYVVNLIVDNSKLKGAPVEIEMKPSYTRLFGATEKEARFGALFTDYTMIRGGVAHRANGGFLVVPVEGLFEDPLIWPSLKQTISNEELEIEEPAARMGYMMTKSLRPQAIPFNAKVVLVGDPNAYEILYSADKDFRDLFRVKADFDSSMERNEENIMQYAHVVCTICSKENLLPVDPSGLAAIVEYSSRMVEDKNKMATLFAEVANVIREANFYAAEEKSKIITRKHIDKALEEKIYRSNMIQMKLQDMVRKKVLLIETEGKKVGQVNGLSVMELGDYAFGMPTRITASVGVGKDGIVNVEREAQMSGPTHTKGVVIIGGYLNDAYAREKPLSLTAKLTFEQSYSGVDGDSASSTELYAILSALSGKPINQSIAVTGSVNQKGEVQAIGGVNQKIEGYFEVCRLRGLTGEQGVMIPESNVQNLMLRDEVLDAVKAKKFHLWSTTSINDGIEHLTGVKAGERNKDGSYPKDSINDLVQRRLSEMADHIKEFRT
jgi:predicted ATP-dependent protease/DNA polymerase III delta prime subunit